MSSRSDRAARWLCVALAAAATFGNTACGRPEHDAEKITVNPTTLPRVGTIDQRYQSYNVEMLEVTGGAFWKPYGAPAASPAPADAVPAGMDPNVYRYRPPIDLANPRLRALAAALGPAYLRVSGTWANTTYFADADPPPADPPAGFSGVLTRNQWHGVVDFASAVDAAIVSSFAISPGTRDVNGVWSSDTARRWLDYTHSVGGDIAAAEFMNEPTMAAMGGAPNGYDAAEYGRDFKAFKEFANRAAPHMMILGPGSVGETPGPWSMTYGTAAAIGTPDLLAASGPGIDVFSYHHYGAASQRCAAMGMPQTTAADALSEDWLARTSATRAYYGGLRDRFEPGKPLWVTEVADAACGGNPWAATFLDTFRYLDQLGRLAKEGVQVVAHNTLAASDYGLLGENDFTPRPNYWAALLWHRFMGPAVLDSGVPSQEGLHLYAHCQPATPGGVSLLAINNNRNGPRTLTLSTAALRYTLDAERIDGPTARLNGQPLTLGAGDALPTLTGTPVPAGDITLAPATSTFLTFPDAANPHCR